MKERMKRIDLIGKFILGVYLAFYTYFFYFVLPSIESIYGAMLNITFMGFIFFIIISAYFYTGNVKEYIREQWNILLLLFLWFLVTFVGYYFVELFVEQPDYYSFLGRNFYYLALMILFVTFVDRKAVDSIMLGMYAMYFLYGLKALPNLVQAHQLGIPPVANKNVIGFFLVPFLAYILVRLKQYKWWKGLWFIIGCILLYLTGARTSFIAFIFIPFFLFIIKKMKYRIRLFYGIYIFLGMATVGIITFLIYPRYPGIDTYFTGRVILWYEYIQYVIENKAILFGTGQVVLTDLLSQIGFVKTLHPHNQLITMFVFNGIIGLLFFIIFLILSIPKKINDILPSDAVLFTIITMLIAESLVPLVDFFFLSFVFIINLLINKLLHIQRVKN